MTTWTIDDYIAAHETVYADYTDLLGRASADELAVQSLCPDWDVRGAIAHTIGVEAVLDGWDPSPDDPPPFGKMGEIATEFADLSPADLAARVGEITSSRLAHLRGLDASAAQAPSITPTGVATYGDFLRIRVFDLWVHARDIAIPLGEQLDDGGLAAEMALDEVARAPGYIVGKNIGLPDGMSIVFHVTGGVERDIALRVDGRATPVESVESPDVEVSADVTTFVMLAAGRIDPQEQIDAGNITWSGDAEWGERAARSLKYTR
jgi:uncharacterized protein (TIGR03083 family)